jgi:hypothetical protein
VTNFTQRSWREIVDRADPGRDRESRTPRGAYVFAGGNRKFDDPGEHAAIYQATELFAEAQPVTRATANFPYVGFTVLPRDGTAPYTLEHAGGSLPAGLAIDGLSLVGTPTEDGTFAGIVLRVVDSGGQIFDLPPFTLTVAPELTISATPVTTATQGEAYDGFEVTVAGGWAPRRINPLGVWPEGLTVTRTGTLTADVEGTPTVNGNFAGMSVMVTDAEGNEAKLDDFLLRIHAVVHLGQAQELDTAFGIEASADEFINLGQAEETDEAFAVGFDQQISVGQAEETDEAFGVTPTEAVAIGQAEELDAAHALDVEEAVQLGLAEEVDAAHEITVDEDTPDWTHRVKITSQAAQIPAAYPFAVVVDCGVLFDGVSTFWSNVKEDGSDIRVTKGDGTTEVARGVRNFSATAERGVVYIHADGISASSDTDFFIYFGNSEADDYADDHALGIQGVWGEGVGREDVRLWLTFDADDISGSGMADQSGLGNDGILENSPTQVQGQVGGALEFDGTNQAVRVEHGASIAGFTAFSVLLWYFYEQNGDMYLFSKRRGATELDWGSFLGFGVDPNWWIVTDTGTSVVGNVASDELVWNHFVGTWDNNASGELRARLNAANVGTSTRTGTLEDSELPLSIGRRGDSLAASFLDGRVGSFKIVARALTNDEITAIYNNEADNAAFWAVDTIETL